MSVCPIDSPHPWVCDHTEYGSIQRVTAQMHKRTCVGVAAISSAVPSAVKDGLCCLWWVVCEVQPPSTTHCSWRWLGNTCEPVEYIQRRTTCVDAVSVHCTLKAYPINTEWDVSEWMNFLYIHAVTHANAVSVHCPLETDTGNTDWDWSEWMLFLCMYVYLPGSSPTHMQI